LVEEARWHRELFARLYHAISDVPGTEELQAELEREAFRLGVTSRAGGTFADLRRPGHFRPSFEALPFAVRLGAQLQVSLA
jgi:hypothetical protein